MNEIDNEIVRMLPPKWATYGPAVVIGLMVLGRIWTALKTNGGLMGIWRSIVFGSSTATKDGKNGPGNVAPIIFAIGTAATLAVAGCGSLDPNGPYKGDRTLYQADVTITTSYDVLHGFVLWEYQNRAACQKISPQIQVAADAIRAKAPAAFASAVAVRDAYSLSKSAPNASALQTALGTLSAMMTEAQTWLTVPGSPPQPTNAAAATLATVRASIK